MTIKNGKNNSEGLTVRRPLHKIALYKLDLIYYNTSNLIIRRPIMAKANAQWNRGLQQFYMTQSGIKHGEKRLQTEENRKEGMRENGVVASSGKGLGGFGNGGDKFQLVTAKDKNGTDVVYGFNVGKHNASSIAQTFINEIAKKIPGINEVGNSLSIRELMNEIDMQTTPEAKNQVISNYMTNVINNEDYKEVAMEVLDEMIESGAYNGILYSKRGKKPNKLNPDEETGF
jgi:hypothetical protein